MDYLEKNYSDIEKIDELIKKINFHDSNVIEILFDGDKDRVTWCLIKISRFCFARYLMYRYEYIKCYWKYIDDETPVLLFYEVDLKEERYATRMAEVFADRTIHQVLELGHDYVTEGPIPKIDEINSEEEFMAELITKEQFEKIYESDFYSDCIDFPKC